MVTLIMDEADQEVFDEGYLGRNPEQAHQMMDSLLSSLRGQRSKIPKIPLVDMHDTVWQRIVKVCHC